jgi:uracil-DNA glycosylase family 4
MPAFSTECRRCERLAGFLDDVLGKHPDYWCRPVPPFGDASARLLVVGLAPGMHGANRSGRPFTGDHAGILLYETLYRHGFATAPASESTDDGLELLDARITNAVKCLPPENKPTSAEVNTCNEYLSDELRGLREGSVVLALGGIAHRAVVRAFGERQAGYKFGHGALHDIAHVRLLDSYHCSRYNQNTGRLTETMFDDVFRTARELLS